MGRRLGKDTITIVEPGIMTGHGGRKDDDWENPDSSTVVRGCYVELALTEEDLLHRDISKAAGNIAAPAGTVCSSRAKVIYAGTDYAVDGRALEGHSYSGRIDYVPIPINNWE